MKIAVVPGDGIGVDVTLEAVKVLEEVCRRRLDPARDPALSLGRGPLSEDRGDDPRGRLRRPLAELRRDLHGGVRRSARPGHEARGGHSSRRPFPARSLRQLSPRAVPRRTALPLKSRGAGDIDFVVFRENTEGAYVGCGGNFKKGTPDEVAVQEDISTRKGVERIIRHAFEFARARGRRKVVMADKSNAMRLRRGPVAADLRGSGPGVSGDRVLHSVRGRSLHADREGPAAVRGRS